MRYLPSGKTGLRSDYPNLLENPQAGDLIVGSGGIRKIRWSRPRMGKRGGVRVFYFDFTKKSRLYFFAVIGKSERENLTKREINILAEMIKTFS